MTEEDNSNALTGSQLQELDQRIDLQVLERVFQYISKNYRSVTVILLPLIVIVVMWSQVDHRLLIGWGVMVLISISIRAHIARLFLKNHVQFKDVKQFGTKYTLSSIYSGLLWSIAAFLFYNNGSVEHQLFLFTLMLSLSLGSMMAGAYWLPGYYVFAIPIIGALIVRLLMEGTVTYIALALFLFLFLLTSISLTKQLNKFVRSEMRLRHNSMALAEALQAKTEEAQQATLAKSKFLAAASHDLRQPMHTLALFFDVLKQSKSEIERASIFPRIEQSLEALRKLFDALLDISRLDANVVKPQLSHFDIAELLEPLAEEYASEARNKALILIVRSKSEIIVSDRLLLERIIRNLLANAIRYTNTGRILLSTRTRGNSILLQVWDTGIGIPQDRKEDIFVEFQQLHNPQRDRSQGLGLGLALVKRMCQLLNHPLTLSSQPGKGSVFSIKIPIGDASQLALNQANPVTHSWDLSALNVLVIDDETDILDAMRTLLLKWDCNVVTAESLFDALNKLDKRSVIPDLILSDLRLGDNQTGIKVIDSLRNEFGASIPGILITGDTSPEQIKTAKESGYEVLQKPIRPAHLRTIIHHRLSK